MQITLNKLIVIFILLLLQGSRLNSAVPEALNAEELKKELSSLFSSEEASKIFWGVRIAKIKDNSEVFSLNRDKRFRPASNMKVVIASAALKALNAEYRFETKLFTDGEIKRDTLKGNLVVVGSGDPTFSVQQVRNWVGEVKKRGIKKIDGSIIGIDKIFDEQKTGLLWSWDNLSNCYSAQISGLQINSNCVELRVSPGEHGFNANIKKIPDTSYVQVINNTISNAKNTELQFTRQQETNKITINGTVNHNSKGLSKWISVNNPTLYFATLFYEELKKADIQISGEPSDSRDTGYELDIKNALKIADSKSAPLKNIINDFLKYSINLYGESVLKTLGFIYFNEGTTYNGRLAINLILKEYELPEDVLFIADGSGLSMLNLISPEYMTKLLYKVSQSYFSGTFFNALSTSGMSGTLRTKLDTPLLKGFVHAKTGYIKNARTLSGYIDTLGGERLVFAIFANNYYNRLDKAELVIDKACSIIRRYKGEK